MKSNTHVLVYGLFFFYHFFVSFFSPFFSIFLFSLFFISFSSLYFEKIISGKGLESKSNICSYMHRQYNTYVQMILYNVFIYLFIFLEWERVRKGGGGGRTYK